MNVNTLLNRVKLQLGLGKYLKTSMTDNKFVKEIIINQCLPKFSEYFRHVLFAPNVVLTAIDMQQGLYEIPLPPYLKESLEQAGMEIIGLRSMKRNDQYSGNLLTNNNWVTLPNGHFYGNEYGSRRLSVAYEYFSVLESNDLGYKNVFVPPNRMRFLDPIIDYRNIHFDLELLVTHANNLSTIDQNLAMTFEKLVNVTARWILWNSEFKFINGLETAFNTANLQIEDWANAKDEREELLKEFEDARVSTMPMSIL